MNQSDDMSLELANAIADDRPVDWDHVTSDGELSGTLKQLRALSQIGYVHKEVASTGSLDEFVLRPELREFIEERDVLFRWGHLEVLERVGEGTYGEVFRAYDPRLRTEVGLKLLKSGGPERERAFVEEGRKLAQVRHPNVVTIHGIACHDDRPGIIMELVGGSTLEDVIGGEGVRSSEEAATIGVKIAGALAAVHHQGLIHRDVKTSNVKRGARGRIVLLDFSLTSDCESEAARRGAGTPGYMAPELLRGSGPSRSSDVYALGVVLYRLVSNRLPVETRDCGELLAHHRAGSAVPLRDRRPDLPSDFVAVVDRALDSNPENRFGSAGELEQALRHTLGQTTSDRVDIDVADPPPSRRRWVIPLALVGTAAVAAALIVPGLTSFEVEAALFRTSDESEERLREGSTIGPGDQLFLEIHGTKEMYAYILAEDEVGNTFLLFPLPALDAKNPLPGGERHQLPGAVAGEKFFWDVTDAGGTERILVVASRKPRPELERILAMVPPAQSGAPAAIEDPDVVGTLRGIGGISPRTAPPPTSGDGYLPQVLVTASEKSGVWMWEMTLTNPVDES